jgi:uroporphyrinogen decarboxylase
MTSREKILTALNHEEPDKVPIDFGGTTCTTLTEAAYIKLKQYMKISESGERIIDPLLNCVQPVESVLNFFNADCRSVRMNVPDNERYQQLKRETLKRYNIEAEQLKDFIIDEYGTLWKKVEYDYSPVGFPLKDADLPVLKAYKWPDPYDPERTQGIGEKAEKLRENTEYAVLADQVCGGPLEQALWLRGYEEFLSDLVLNQKFAYSLLNIITEIDLGFLEMEISHVGKYVDIICMGDDLGTQMNLLISPEMYRKFIKPCHKRLFSYIHSKTNAKVWLHSCGSIYSIIPDLIEIGVDILNPVQCGASNMGLRKLKKEFGKLISFWGGGINVQTLPFKSISDIENEVMEAINIMATGGGYVFSGTHNILPETEGVKTYTAFKTASKFRN